MISTLHFVFFFFQAEDGIRDLTVTGVQTCALPITIRFTSGRVRLASARVKYFLGTETIYAEMPSPDDYYSLDKLRMRNKSHDSFVAVHYHDRRSNMRVRLFQLLDLEPRQLRLRCH